MAVKITQPQQPGMLQNILSALISPLRKTLGSGIEAGFNIGNKLGMGNADQLGIKNPVLSQSEVRNVRMSPITESAKNIAGIGAYTVPFPAAGGFKAALAPGALSGLLSSLSQDNVTLEDLVKGAGTGAISAGVLNKLLGGRAAKAVTGEEEATNKLTQAGTDLRRKAINPQVSSGPTGPAEEARILAIQSERGLTGSPRKQWVAAGKQYQQLTSDIKKVLPEVSSRQALSPTLVRNRLENAVRNSADFIPGDPRYESILTKKLSLFDQLVGNGQYDANKAFEYVTNLDSDLGLAFNKVSGKSAAPLKETEDIGLALRKEGDNIFSELAPEAKALRQQQSDLHEIFPTLDKARKETAQLPIIGGRVSTGPLRGAQDFAGRTLESLGGAGGPQAATQPAVSNALKQLMLRAGVPSAAALGGGQDAVPTTSQASPITDTGTSSGQIDDQQILKKLLAAGVLSGEISSSDVTALQSLGLLDSGKTEKLTEAQQARADVGSLSSQALRQLETGAIKTGPIAPRFENLKSVFNAGDEPTIDFNILISSIRSTIAKARGGTALSAQELRILNDFTPKVGDSEQTLRAKLMMLQQQFGDN